MMAATVYILCTLTSLGCWILLFRGYRRTRLRLLLWSSLCFAVLTVGNIFLYLDLSVFPEGDLSLIRTGLSLLAVLVLLWGLIFESD